MYKNIRGIKMQNLQINIKDLKPGMMLSNEIVYKNKVLIGRGVILTSNMIYKLKELYNLNEINNFNKNISDNKTAIKILDNLSDDLKKLFHSISHNSHNTLKVNLYTKNLIDTIKLNDNIIKNIIINGSDKDCIYRHSVNVAILSYLIGNWLQFDDSKLQSLVYSALIHDYGKSTINKDIINKATPLTNTELDIIKKHPVDAYNEIKNLNFIPKSILFSVLMHHERCDGSGYPLSLKGNQIHEFAKIIAISDTFDALNSNRIYKNKKRPLEILKIIQEESLDKLDFSITIKFLQGICNFYIGQHCILNNKQICKIIKLELNNISSPLILCNNEFIDLSKKTQLYIENFI